MRMFTLGVRTALAVAASVAVFATASNAAAYDWKRIPASSCTIMEGSWFADYGHYAWFPSASGGISVWGQGSVPSGNPAQLSCPVIRDVLQNTNGLAGLVAHVNDPASTGEIRCYGYSVSETGSIIQSVGPIASGVSWAGGYKQLPMDMTSSHAWSGYNVICYIDPGYDMTLHAIGWAEHNGDGW